MVARDSLKQIVIKGCALALIDREGESSGETRAGQAPGSGPGNHPNLLPQRITHEGGFTPTLVLATKNRRMASAPLDRNGSKLRHRYVEEICHNS